MYKDEKNQKQLALFLIDKNGLAIVISEPRGLHSNDLFMNAYDGFDSKNFRKICALNGIIANIDFNKRNSKTSDDEYLLDDKLYKERFAVECTNAWIDAFKSLLV